MKPHLEQAVIIRVDAGNNIGMGHLMRCIAFAQACQRAKISAVFLLDTVTENLINTLKAFNFPFYSLAYHHNNELNYTEQNQEDELTTLIQKLNRDYQIQYLILDGYHFTLNYRQLLKSILKIHQIQLAIMDDNGGEIEGALTCADVIINPTCMADSTPDYKILAPNATVFAGEQYRLLRQEFVEQPQLAFTQKRGIVVTMGGSDPLNYTEHCLTVLASLNLNTPVTVLIGSGFKHAQSLIKQIEHLPNNFCYIYQADNIAKLFAEAEFVISAAGGTQFELYAMQTPAILLVSFDNQWRNSQAAQLQGWAEVLDFRQKFDALQLNDAVKQMMQDKVRYQMQEIMTNSSRAGADNLVEALIQN
ncbi:UDP-2,4-diacetamido-2,4,6-trideoxy-beta-L-altropyranose hydrolase [Catenovulum sp. 2E275]|uniref:UDP-2,4-diacetamido-2,4, 6-trideoxy-beta-L-altropyranose hydrolase n=1 Tax=Catenovulum sp. 2E275 TaxID=2980497 RepID=UPI0021D00A9B|nr:UDP-2,4-diacetamido-2,4,6-trideoxy-beta-L-altropyranose hydrolase [Catenovulum sp. 2E275]MCU4674755.1 UDP-2,4-diacetamido-2,4,6-trideoxy-beta-L-altropyranose hydrolase [Catenovulum sp. 2E275]